MGEDQNKKSRPGKWVYSLHNRDLIRETGLQLKTGSWLYLILGLLSALALKTNKSLRHRAGSSGANWLCQPSIWGQRSYEEFWRCATCATCTTRTTSATFATYTVHCNKQSWESSSEDARHVNVVIEKDKRGEASCSCSCWVTPYYVVVAVAPTFISPTSWRG